MDSDEEAIPIDSFGDLIVSFTDDAHLEPVSFRVSSSQLKEVARFFQVLLDPKKFAEGHSIDQKRKELLLTYPSLEKVPDRELPHVSIHGIGSIGNVKSLRSLLRDFLNIIHSRGDDFHAVVTDSPTPHTTPRLSNLANLVAVAYHFDVVDVIKKFAYTQNIFTRLMKSGKVLKTGLRVGTGKWDNTAEERCRMLVLLSFCLDYAPWAKESVH
jgi:hypothetical protein